MRKLIIIFASLLFFCVNSFADNVFSLGEIKFSEKLIKPAKQSGDILFRGISLDNESLKFSGEAGTNSIFNTISILPSINLDSDDPFGLGDKRLRIRGTSDYFIGLTVDGIPMYGIMPIGPRDYIFDSENFEKVKVYSGSTPADLMTGSGNRGGAIEVKLKKPSKKFNINISQSFGSFQYSKTFLRIDSGTIFKTKSRFYTSFSYTDADKWKGDGKLGPRKNFSFGFSQNIGEKISIDFYANYNSFNRNLFKGLTYSEAKNLDKFYYHDYATEKTGNPLFDYDYYNYNKFSGINRDYFGIIKFKISPYLKIKFKPYYSRENNSRYEGMRFGNFAFVLNKVNDSKRYGIVSEFNYKYNNLDITGGYWHEITDFNPIIKKYGISPNGLIFTGYGWYTKNTSKGKVVSPYLKLAYSIKKLKIQTGAKYFYYKEPAKKGYWYKNGTFIYDPMISIKKKTYDQFLPSAGIEYDFTKDIKASLSYSKKYQRPYAYGPLSSFYFKYYWKKFKPLNISLQDLFDGLDMEKVDSYDFVLRTDFQNFSLTADLYYQKHHDILVSLEDPRVKLSYQQNDGEAKAYGIELSGEYLYSENFKLFANGNYNKMEFTKNVVRAGKTYPLDGKQFPDTPKIMFKTGLIYSYNNFQIIPVYKYIGKRYGDALNQEHINPYSLVNLQLNYKLKKIEFGLEVDNLFNHKYIGRIDTWDDSTGTTTYYAASPFTMLIKINGNF